MASNGSGTGNLVRVRGKTATLPPRPAPSGSPGVSDPGQARLRAESLTVGYGDRIILPDISLAVPDGRITVILGANACGKSTLLKALARLLRPRSGVVSLDGRTLSSIHPRQLARMLGLLPQSPIVPEGITVGELVSRGRHPHRRMLRGAGLRDEEAVRGAMEATGVLALSERCVDALSGGQRQRVWIAMALAQETELLLLDEPTTFLDIAHQVEILDLLTDLNRTRGTTIVMVLHDLNLSARYADHIVALQGGRVLAQGKPAEVVTEAVVRSVYGLECRVVPDPVSGTPLVVPVGRHHAG